MTTTVAQPVHESAPIASEPAWGWTAIVLLWGMVAAGAALRVGRFVHWRALWLDEIYLANSVIGRSWHDLLFKPLDDWQAAPVGFLVLEHLIARIFGAGERALRVVSLIFGLASLPLAAMLARRLLSARAGVLFVALLAFAGPAIYYSNELKPYACDLTCSLAITWCAIWMIDSPTRGRAIVAAVVGSLSILFSFPAAFVLAGAGIVVLVLVIQRRDPRAILRVAAVAGVCGLVFAANYLLFVRPFSYGAAHPHLVQYWEGDNAFMPLSPLPAVTWLFTNFWGIAKDPGGLWLDYPDAAAIAVVVGIVLALRRRDLLLIVLAPLPLVIAASALRQYPFRDRLALFYTPQMLILSAVALDALWKNFAGKIAAVCIGGLILIPSAWRAGNYFIHPPGREESLPAYRWVAQQWQPGDRVYLTRFAEPSYRYYASQAGWPAAATSAGTVYVQPQAFLPSDVLVDVRKFADQKRVWVVVIHAEGGDFDVRQLTIAAFDAMGTQRLSFAKPGAAAFLYDCTAPPLPH